MITKLPITSRSVSYHFMAAQAHTSTDPLAKIFAYRAIDLRDRFPQPLETFREALECLQSNRSYMADMSGEIIAYLRGGYALTIPDHFFIRNRSEVDTTLVSPEENDAVCEEVEAWLRTTLHAHEKDLPQTVALVDRPYSLDQLLKLCAPHAPQPEGRQAWQDMPGAGREISGSPDEKDI